MADADASKRDLSLLADADGTLAHGVTLRVAAKFLHMSTANVHHHMRRGALGSEGSGRQRRVLVSSLLAYVPHTQVANGKEQMAKLHAGRTPAQRSEFSSKAWHSYWDNIPHGERSKISKRNSEKVPPERRSEIHKAHHAKKSPQQRSEIAKKRSDNMTPEAREAGNKNLAWFKNLPPEERSRVAKKRRANLPPDRREAGDKARHSPEAKKKAAATKAARKAEVKAALERLKAIENGAATKTREPIGSRLRAARMDAGLSREKAVKGLFRLGISITVEAIKKHESDKSRPRPALQQVYSSLYGKTKNELFGSKSTTKVPVLS